jgi:hypothetical protein
LLCVLNEPLSTSSAPTFALTVVPLSIAQYDEPYPSGVQ